MDSLSAIVLSIKDAMASSATAPSTSSASPSCIPSVDTTAQARCSGIVLLAPVCPRCAWHLAMGVPGTCPGDLVLFDAAGLQKTIGQILAELNDHGERIRRLEEHTGQDPKMSVAKRLALLENAEKERGVVLPRVSQDIDNIGERLKLEEQTRAEDIQTLQSRLAAMETQAAELEVAARKGEDGLEVVLQLRKEAEQNWKHFEARVRQAEEKASQCRRDAKEHRALDEEHVAAVGRLEKQLEAVNKAAAKASELAEEANSSPGDSSTWRGILDFVEASVRDLEKGMRSKANAATMEAMRKDLEQSQRALRDAVNALTRAHEQHAALLARAQHAQSRRPNSARAVGFDTTAPGLDTGTHCLFCGADATPPPQFDGACAPEGSVVYEHVRGADDSAGAVTLEDSEATDMVMNTSGRKVVRPPLSPPSIPRSASSSQVVVYSTPASSKGCAAATTAAAPRASGPIRSTAQQQRRSERCTSKQSTTAAGSVASQHWASSSPSSSRPSSAGTLRPSSAGALRRQRPTSAHSDAPSPATGLVRDSLPIGSYLSAPTAAPAALPSLGASASNGSLGDAAIPA